MLVVALTVVVVVAAIMLALLVGVQHRANAAKRTLWNAQADFAALALATAPSRPESLELPGPVVVQIETDRVTLRTSNGTALSAARIPSFTSTTPADPSKELQ